MVGDLETIPILVVCVGFVLRLVGCMNFVVSVVCVVVNAVVVLVTVVFFVVISVAVPKRVAYGLVGLVLTD